MLKPLLPAVREPRTGLSMNVKGGSLALGHPFAATGGRLVGSAAKILASKGQGRILLSVCTAGGMGVAAILER